MSARFRPKTEIQIDGSWVDISADVLNRETVEITRGLPDEGNRVNPGSIKLLIDNSGGKYSPRNPGSPYYGKLKRNTPLRFSLAGPPTVARGVQSTTDGGPDGVVYADNESKFGVSEFDLRIHMRLTEEPTTDHVLASKYETLGDQRDWAFYRAVSGALAFLWSPDGTFASRKAVFTTNGVPWWQVSWLRVTALNNGPGGNGVVTFYRSDDGVNWDILEEPYEHDEPIVVHHGSEPLKVGGTSLLTGVYSVPADYYRFQMFDANGDPIVDADFTQAEPDSASYTDATGTVWHPDVYGSFTDRHVRFVGEVSSWPQSWEQGGTDRTVPLTASGILRRLGQGEAPMRSVTYLDYTAPARPQPVAYWPMEDGEYAQEFAPYAPTHDAMVISATGGVKPGQDDSLVNSGPLPHLKGGYVVGNLPGYVNTGQFLLAFHVKIPEDGVGGLAETRPLMTARVTESQTVSRWVLEYQDNAGGRVRLLGYDHDGNVDFNSDWLISDPSINGHPHLIWIQLTQSGNNLVWRILRDPIGAPPSPVGWVSTGTFNNCNLGKISQVQFSAPGVDFGETAVGHVFAATDTDALEGKLGSLIGAYSTEAANHRVYRLCQDLGIPLRIFLANDPDYDAAQPMGPQGIKPLVELLQESADAEAGLLYESRDRVGLEFRTTQNLYNQVPDLVLDYRDGCVTANPVEDDRYLLNDAAAKQERGSTARYVKETGTLSVEEVGRYDSEITVSHAHPISLPHRASWAVHLGTWDDSRFPEVLLNLTKDPSIDVSRVDVGSVVRLTNMPAGLHFGDLNLLVRGYTEEVNLAERIITLTCEPADPWYVWEVEHPVFGRLDTDGSELAVPLDDGNPTAYVTTESAKPLWITTDERPQDFPFYIQMNGEVAKVTAVSGDNVPQIFTLERGINGVFRSHPVGTRVNIARSEEWL